MIIMESQNFFQQNNNDKVMEFNGMVNHNNMMRGNGIIDERTNNNNLDMPGPNSMVMSYGVDNKMNMSMNHRDRQFSPMSLCMGGNVFNGGMNMAGPMGGNPMNMNNDKIGENINGPMSNGVSSQMNGFNSMGPYNNGSMPFGGFTDPEQEMVMMRKRQMACVGLSNNNGQIPGQPPAKRPNLGMAPNEEDTSSVCNSQDSEHKAEAPTVQPSKEGIKFYSRNDVLCGRGGGTNVHPGNRRFRDLINANRRAYLKARKNDKPAISRSIVRTIREMNGRFLKKDEKQGLWFEIGDDLAREKTSQALRQRAPEMRKILFEDEQRQQAQQEAMMRRRMMSQGMSMSNYGPSQIQQIHQMQQMGGPSTNMQMSNNNFNNSLSENMQDSSPSNFNNPQDMALFARYNSLQQKNSLVQEKNMLLQRLAMSGLNPQMINNHKSDINQMTSKTLLGQNLKQITPRGA
mmetsp:Transcript_5802/g.11869  ORF Transcript_5802/g.11869 Transcript_5802/m.11869 type:complete len:459 (-) Transcript_5802:518-1894(-)